MVLASRPQGVVTPENFRLETKPMPSIKEGELLVRNHYLSLDPYMRMRMEDVKSYAAPQALDEVMIGGTMGEVIESKNAKFKAGDKIRFSLGQVQGKWVVVAVENDSNP
jgi:NADPH-dependent curcumin reductase CurA